MVFYYLCVFEKHTLTELKIISFLYSLSNLTYKLNKQINSPPPHPPKVHIYLVHTVYKNEENTV